MGSSGSGNGKGSNPSSDSDSSGDFFAGVTSSFLATNLDVGSVRGGGFRTSLRILGVNLDGYNVIRSQ